MSVRLGTNPIAWSNDDLRELGGMGGQVRLVEHRGAEIERARAAMADDGDRRETGEAAGGQDIGDLLQAGAHIYEYAPSMIHAKVLLIDSQWAVVGSTNIDPRSFKLNDEVNLASNDPSLAQRLEQDFTQDLQRAKEVNYEEWRRRPVAERIHEMFGGLVQQPLSQVPTRVRATRPFARALAIGY